MSKFALGDVVILKSGGKEMVVDEVKTLTDSDNNQFPGVSCIWHSDDGELQTARYRDEVLKKLR